VLRHTVAVANQTTWRLVLRQRHTRISGDSPRITKTDELDGVSVSVLCQRRSARLKQTGERLASDSDQSDVDVCPEKRSGQA
jgi:hypothetical protein